MIVSRKVSDLEHELDAAFHYRREVVSFDAYAEGSRRMDVVYFLPAGKRVLLSAAVPSGSFIVPNKVPCGATYAFAEARSPQFDVTQPHVERVCQEIAGNFGVVLHNDSSLDSHSWAFSKRVEHPLEVRKAINSVGAAYRLLPDTKTLEWLLFKRVVYQQQ